MAAPSEPSPGWAEIASSFKDLDSTPAAESKNYAPVFAALQQRVQYPICHRPTDLQGPATGGTTRPKTRREANAPTSISASSPCEIGSKNWKRGRQPLRIESKNSALFLVCLILSTRKSVAS